MEALTENQRKKIKTKGLAEKHKCSQKYVEMVLNGKRESNSDLAKAILTDANALLNILENDNQ